jgi:hypothetical protein
MPTSAAETALLEQRTKKDKDDRNSEGSIIPGVYADKHTGPVRRERPQGTKKARRGTADPDAETAESPSRSMDGKVSVLHQRNELERERLLYR